MYAGTQQNVRKLNYRYFMQRVMVKEDEIDRLNVVIVEDHEEMDRLNLVIMQKDVEIDSYRKSLTERNS